MTDYKYDLALSLRDEDERIAQVLIRLLPGDLSVFLYSTRQKELVGDDGVDAFSAVFAREARTVAVLHRRGWRRTRWTAIEEGAIRTRFWNQGADLVGNGSRTVPMWRTIDFAPLSNARNLDATRST